MFSCEYCEIFKNTFFNRTTPVGSSEVRGVMGHLRPEIMGNGTMGKTLKLKLQYFIAVCFLKLLIMFFV